MSGASVQLGDARTEPGARAEGPERGLASGGRLRLFRNAHRYFALLAFMVVLGFVPGYLFVFPTASWALHAHFPIMLLWVLMPAAQSWFIRTGRYRWHRVVGRASYIVLPLGLLTGVLVTQQYLRKHGDGVSEIEHVAAVLSILGPPLIATTFALALYHRKRPEIHARLMTAAALVTVGAVLPRYFMFLFPLDPEQASHATYLSLELILVALIAHDLRHRYHATPFIPFLVVHLQQHWILHYAPNWAWWRAMVEVIHG